MQHYSTYIFVYIVSRLGIYVLCLKITFISIRKDGFILKF